MKERFLKTVPLILAVVCLVLLSRPSPMSLVFGGLIVFCGEALRVWASGHLIRNNELTTSGPYAYMRDPLYLGRLFLLIGFCVMGWGNAWIILLLGLAVFFFTYMPRKHRKEMARLEEIFGEEYRQYAAYAKSIIPRLSPYPSARKRAWSFDLFWMENREHYLLSGTLLLSVILVAVYVFS